MELFRSIIRLLVMLSLAVGCAWLGTMGALAMYFFCFICTVVVLVVNVPSVVDEWGWTFNKYEYDSWSHDK